MILDSQVNDKYKTGLGYHAVPHPFTGNFMPPKPDLIFADMNEHVVSESVTSVPAVATSEAKTSESKPNFAKVEFVKPNEQVKSPRKSVKQEEHNRQAEHPRKNSQSPRGNKRNWNNLMSQRLENNFKMLNKAYYICESFEHLQYNCKHNKRQLNGQRVVRPVWNNARRVNHQNSPRMTPPHPKRNFLPRAVLMRSGLKTLNTARQNSSRAAVSINTARPIPRPTVNSARPVLNIFNRAHSHVRRPFDKFTSNKNNNVNETVNTVWGNVTTAGPRAIGKPQLELKEKGFIDSVCSRHMAGNMSYLSDYEKIDGGYVAFGGDPKGGKITGKGKIRTGKLDFEDLLDESQVLPRVPRKNNMYNVDLKNVVLVTPSNLSMQRNVEYPKALHYWVNSTRSENDY
ncbi:hypothetical protein Tco_0809349 [Tanacetum coccineum]